MPECNMPLLMPDYHQPPATADCTASPARRGRAQYWMGLTLLLLSVLLCRPVDAGTLDILVTNLHSSSPVADLEVHALEESSDGQLIWRNMGTSDSTGRLTLELPGLESGTPYVLISIPYNGG